MRASLAVPTVLSIGILTGVTGFGLARYLREPAAAGSPLDASVLARLDERMATVETRLAELAKLEAEVERLKREEPETPSIARPESSASDAGEESDPDAAGEEPAAPSGKLEQLLEAQGMRQEMEGFVARVYEQSRDARRQREREEAEAREREIRELSEGPYGKFNYRVNSLAKKLELDARQKEYAFNLLTKYEERAREAKNQLLPADGSEAKGEMTEQRMKQYMVLKQELGQQFDNDLLLGLRADQQEAYKDLSPDERGAGGNVRMIAVDGGVKIFQAGAEAIVEPLQRVIEKIKGQEPAAPAGK